MELQEQHFGTRSRLILSFFLHFSSILQLREVSVQLRKFVWFAARSACTKSFKAFLVQTPLHFPSTTEWFAIQKNWHFHENILFETADTAENLRVEPSPQSTGKPLTFQVVFSSFLWIKP